MADDQDDTTDDAASDDGEASSEGADALRTARDALRAMIGGGSSAFTNEDGEGSSAGDRESY